MRDAFDDLGEYSHHVREVFSFAMSPEFLRGGAVCGAVEPVLALEDAWSIANSDGNDDVIPITDTPWGDKIGEELGKLRHGESSIPVARMAELHSIYQPFVDKWFAAFDVHPQRERLRDVIEAVANDLVAISAHRSARGVVENSFFEALFDVYRRRCWPCGWTADGKFRAWTGL